MSAERKEVIEDTDAFEAEHAGKAFRKRMFQRSPRPDIRGKILPLRIRQRTTIELAVGRQRQRIEHDKRRRHHVIGQTRIQMLTKIASVDLGNQREIGYELLILRPLMPRTRDDHSLTHRRMTGELRFDLTKLDTKSTNLHLMIVAPEELQTAIGPIASEITRAIKTRAGNEGIVDKALCGQFRPIEITTRHTRATDVQLAHRADRREPTLRIEQIDRQIGNPNADRTVAVRAILARQRPVGHMHGRLGDAVHVDESRLLVRMTRVPRLEHRRIQRLATEDHVTQRSGRVVGLLRLNQRTKRARRLIKNGDALLLKQTQEVRREPGHMLRHDHQLAAITQRAPHFPYREIEGERVEQAPDIAFVETEPVLRRVEQTDDLRMLDHHALGLAGRTGRVDHISEMRRSDRRLRIVLRKRVIERCIGIEHGERSRVAERFAASCIGDQEAGRRVDEDMAQAFARVSRIERHIRAACLQYRQQRNHQADASLHAQRHPIFRADAQRDQMMGKPVGARIELRIRERLVLEDECDGIRHTPCLLLEQLMDAQIRRIRRGRIVPRLHEQVARVGRQHIELIDRRLRRFFERLCEARKRLFHIPAQLLGRQRRDGLRRESEAVAVVIDGERQRIVRALFRTEKLDAVEGLMLIGGALIVAIVQQRVEERRGSRNAAAALGEREWRMLMLQ
ncbi:hypothetical protein AWB74_04548 [Caballeronia arvi]|uniref:Uncharacterized protein n=1 Tax=Caballeronia arvi TaxID=1777135 RepID=A0A158JY57_9BURK|nr:hypothetical protein AWB74_04548 [Caballeronia arvi]